MKNIFRTVAASVLALLPLVGCQKEEIIDDCGKNVTFFANSIETRTAFGTPDGTTYPTLWTENDTEVAVSLNAGTKSNATVIPASDYKTATFDARVKYVDTTAYAFTVVSPASALIGVSPAKGPNVEVPTTQTPTSTSVDESAQILIATSETFTSFPTEPVKLAFIHFTAYGRISVLNLESGATISSISLTADKNWAGKWNYNGGDPMENSASSTITLNTSSAADNWFACAPVDLGGKNVKVTVTTDKGDYVKTITLPSGKKFVSGKIAKFAIDFSGIKPIEDVVYTLVTSADQLTVGSKVIIAAKDTVVAMATQATNNRSGATVTKTGNTIVNPTDNIQTLIVESGTKTGTVAFNTGNGYLYAASSSNNYLKTQTNLNDNASFTYAIGVDGTATLTAQGTNTRNIMRYNPNGGNPIFACYGSASQKDIAIYKLEGYTYPEYSSLAELVAAGTPTTTGTIVKVTLTDEPIKSLVSTNGIFIEVGDRDIEIYCKNRPDTWVAGGTVSGTLTCPWKLYSSTWELCPSAWTELTYTASSNVPVTGVALDKSTATITVGANATLVATVAPADATDKSVAWESSNPAVATVDSGVVTGVAAGTATITVTTEDGGKTASCTVTVKEATSGGYSLVTDASTLKSGDVIVLGCAANGKAAGAMGTGTFLTSVDATVSNGVLTSSNVIEITLGGSAGAWTLTTSEGQITTSAAKAFKLNTGTQKTWTISIASDGVATITGGSYGSIQYNTSNPRFVNYTSSQDKIEIYKKN